MSTPLCNACRYSTPRYSNLVFCTHQSNIIISKMDGEPEMDRSAAALRDNEKACGPKGVWFVALTVAA